jgi:antitoxin component YwqK of YwqJK toxin-antitoxin module
LNLTQTLHSRGSSATSRRESSESRTRSNPEDRIWKRLG